MAGNWRATQRLLRLCWHIMRGMRLARSDFAHRPAAQQQVVQQWAQQFLALAGVQLQVRGTVPAPGPLLLVANHQSWLDIPCLHAAQYCRFIAKAEIAHWPAVGTLARAAGTLFVQRGVRRDTQRTIAHMAVALREGDRLCVFPEGTVGSGPELLPFHGNMLQAALEADVAVQPAALTFVDARTGSATFIPCEAYPDEPMLRSLWRTLKSEHLIVVVRYGLPEKAQGRDRRVWAQDLRTQVQALRALDIDQTP